MARLRTLTSQGSWVPSTGQNSQPFTDNGDVSIWVKNYISKCPALHWQWWRLHTSEKFSSWTNKQTKTYLNDLSLSRPGHKGRHVESDLMEEHSICKSLINSLGAKYLNRLILRQEDLLSIANFCLKFDDSINLKSRRGRHSSAISQQIREWCTENFERHFSETPGRKCYVFLKIKSLFHKMFTN